MLNRSLNNQRGMSVLFVLAAVAIVVAMGYLVSSRIAGGYILDVLSSAKRNESSEFDDEIKLIISKNYCGLMDLQAGKNISATGGFPSNSSYFSVTNATDVGLSDGTTKLVQNSLFYDMQIDSILVGPFDHRWDYQWEGVGRQAGIEIKGLPINKTREFVALGESQYLAMLYISAHPRTTNAKGSLLSTFPVIIKYDGGISYCRSAFSKGSMISTCEAFGGQWNEDLFMCALDSQKAKGLDNTCAVDDSCSVQSQYKM